MMQRDMPTSQVPTYLKARVAGGHAVPSVEVIPQSHGQKGEGEDQQAGAGGRRKAAGEQGDEAGAELGEEERHAMLEYVVKGLNEELLIELLEGLH
jgi:hypothetical protein